MTPQHPHSQFGSVAGETHTFTLYTDRTAADVNETTEM